MYIICINISRGVSEKRRSLKICTMFFFFSFENITLASPEKKQTKFAEKVVIMN